MSTKKDASAGAPFQPTPVRASNPNNNDQRQGIIMAMVSCLLCYISLFFHGRVWYTRLSSTNRNLSGRSPSILLRKTVLSLKSPTGLSLLRSTAQTRTFENTLISAACKKTQGKLWQKERGPDGAGPLDRMMRCSKISAAFIAVFKNSAEQNGIFTICSLRILLRWENRIRQKDKVSAGKIRIRQ